jgi:hypothetical protein
MWLWLGPFLVGEQTTFHIEIAIWILHLGRNNEVVVEGITRPHKGSQASTTTNWQVYVALANKWSW